MKKASIGLCAAVVICSAGVAHAQGHHVRWLLRIMPLLFRTMRRPMDQHRPMGRGGGVTPRSLTTPTRRLAPAGLEPFSPGETETKTRVDDISGRSCPSAFRPTPDGTPSAPPSSSAWGEYEGIVRVSRRVQHLLAESACATEDTAKDARVVFAWVNAY